MRTPRVQITRRGLVRGVFVSGVLATCVLGCDKSKEAPHPAADASVPAIVDAGPVAADAAVDVAPDLPAPPPPAQFAPPWTKLSPPWKQLVSELAASDVGRISGEVWGKDAIVRGIVRGQCGRGTMLQAIYQAGDDLRVTPAMPVRFFGLDTDRPVSYHENMFEVTTYFTEDTPERLAGNLKIVFEERGVEKTFVDLTVDGKPLDMLLRPRMGEPGNVPEFQECHPSGRFVAKTTDGRSAHGFLHAGRNTDGTGVLIEMLFSAQSGIRLILFSPKAVKEPWEIDLSKPKDPDGVQLIVEAFNTAELTSPAEAEGPNLEREERARVRHGVATLTWRREKPRPVLDVSIKDLTIPLLLDGPLRGTTFSELTVEAVAYPQDTYPAPPSDEPLSLRQQ